MISSAFLEGLLVGLPLGGVLGYQVGSWVMAKLRPPPKM